MDHVLREQRTGRQRWLPLSLPSSQTLSYYLSALAHTNCQASINSMSNVHIFRLDSQFHNLLSVVVSQLCHRSFPFLPPPRHPLTHCVALLSAEKCHSQTMLKFFFTRTHTHTTNAHFIVPSASMAATVAHRKNNHQKQHTSCKTANDWHPSYACIS